MSKAKIVNRLMLASLPGIAVAIAFPAQAENIGDKIPNSYICVFKKDAVARTKVREEADRMTKAEGGQVTYNYSTVIQGFAARVPDGGGDRIKAANPNIAFCEQDQLGGIPPSTLDGPKTPPPPPPPPVQPPQETPWGIARVNGGAAGSFATAWVLDTGIDPTHPDLNVDTARSRSFVTGVPSFADQNGHGTHVAGTIAAKNNTIGVIGVAPGAPVVAVRVLNAKGRGAFSDIIAGVDYVGRTGQPGDVSNMSLGGGVSAALDQAVINASAGGIRFVIAAGNSAANANNSSPARVNGPNIFTVSAFANGGTFATFSNFGNPPIDWAEPGVAVKSTWLAGGYNTISGTSMATPHLAGILLAGGIRQDGVVTGDKDAIPDPIGVR